jgi:hypothetical protein
MGGFCVHIYTAKTGVQDCLRLERIIKTTPGGKYKIPTHDEEIICHLVHFI